MNHSRRTLQNVIIASQERKRQAEGNSLDTKGNEEQIWSNIENILQYWAKKLAEFQALVGPLDKTRDGRKTLNWGDKTLLQFKLNRMEPKMAAYENDMNKCVYWITLSLSCVKMSIDEELTSQVTDLIKLIKKRDLALNLDTDNYSLTDSTQVSSENFLKFLHLAQEKSSKSLSGDGLSKQEITPKFLDESDVYWEQQHIEDFGNEDKIDSLSPTVQDRANPRATFSSAGLESSIRPNLSNDEQLTPYSKDLRSSNLLKCLDPAYEKQVQTNFDSRDVETSKHFDFNGLDPSGKTYLASVVAKGNIMDVQKMLKCYADPNQVSTDKTPLMYAMDCQNTSVRKELVSLLVHHGADMNVEIAGRTVLHHAVSKQDSSMVDILLKHGAQLEVSADESSPLLLAAQLGQREIVLALCQRQAKVNATCSEKLTPLHWAVSGQEQAGQEGHSVVDDFHEVLRILLHHGADVNALDGEKKTPLHHAVDRGDEGSAKVLLDTSSALGLHLDLEAKDLCGRTPLHSAIKDQSLELIKLLLQKGATQPDNLQISAPAIKNILRKHSVGSSQAPRSPTSSSKLGRRSPEPGKWPFLRKLSNT
ncbi:MAG: hypothetical protein MMC33_006353 [Icmadophila ericetorum]|nr:hypothetical protein [Icmadophila ericetorum]